MEPHQKIEKEMYREYYKTLKPLSCPALGQEVTFNAKGFKHITYLDGQRTRNENAQATRFKLLPLAVKLIGLTTTYQEYEYIVQNIEVTHEGVKTTVTKDVSFWGLIAIIDNRKIKVILRKVGEGLIHFWSVIPSWKTNKRDAKLSLMKGNPQTD